MLQPQPAQEIKPPACWEHGTRSKVSVPSVLTERWETIRGMCSSTSLYTEASFFFFFFLEIRFGVMNSQGFPCFAGQKESWLNLPSANEAIHQES